MKHSIFLFFLLTLLAFVIQARLFSQDTKLLIHIRGVYETKVSLIPLAGSSSVKPIAEVNSINYNHPASLAISKETLPGEFIIRFDYKEKESSTPYPSEKHILINNQNLELFVNPLFCNNADSAWFQKDEIENKTFDTFSKENDRQKQKLTLLQNFLMSYDDTKSDFYLKGILEYEKRRQLYNRWLLKQIDNNKEKFVSSMFRFQYVTKVEFKGSEGTRIQSAIDHYFDGIDFKDALIIKTANIKEWMNNYVNLYGAAAITLPIRDSLFTLAGKTSIEKARKGHPLVYGWMVDYFYNGYESFNMTAGLKMLEHYLSDPNCLTTKKQAISKRLTGMETLKPGSAAPDFSITDDTGNSTTFNNYKTNTPYKLLLFWSADCEHCKELVKKIYPWYQQSINKNLLSLFAVSVDQSETEVAEWKNTITQLPAWKHIRPEGGINSREANAYFILSVPVMFLIDTETNRIIALPETLEQLSQALK